MTRDVTAIDLGTQAIAVSASATVTAPSLATMPARARPRSSTASASSTPGSAAGRLNGAAWGSCGACHVDGLSDNVTWYFARGPRQTTSLDGTFDKADPTDQRILNWTAINDEIADFEANVRGISGGVGAIVSTANKACTVATQATDCPNSQVCNPTTLLCNLSNLDRINTLSEVPAQQALDGSSTDAATPSGASAHAHSVIGNWADITAWIQTIRSPRAPTNLVTADVTAGAALFAGQGNCTGCHSGAKWTISSAKFYAPGDVPNDAFGGAGGGLAVVGVVAVRGADGEVPGGPLPVEHGEQADVPVGRSARRSSRSSASCVRWARSLPTAPRRPGSRRPPSTCGKSGRTWSPAPKAPAA